MGSAYLPDFIDNAEYELEILISSGLRGELDFKGLQKLCNRFRQRGVCSFLLSGDARAFSINAMQSAGAFMTFLPTIDDAQKVTSEARPFYDAIGGEFWDCAACIAKSGRTTWNRTKEYEEDFLFVLFQMKHFFLKASQSDCRAIIDAHEKAAEGADQPHRDVCLAFLEKDGALFDAALRQILQIRADRVEAMVERDAIPEESWSWLRYFSSEGLALLKLAERAGIPTGEDYLHVSESLRKSPPIAFDSDAWRQLHV